MTVLVTGSSGFVGHSICRQMTEHGQSVRGAQRTESGAPNNWETVVVAPLSAQTDWTHALTGCRAVIHAAARVHVMAETAENPLIEFRRTNVDGTLRLATQAAASGVNRFVFVSSIKVNGEQTEAGRPFRYDDQPNPQDPYGVSKAEAEQGLRALAVKTGMEVVVVRPPLVYGPGVKANFSSLMRAVRLGMPLPLRLVTDNRRSLVALDNLVDLLIFCSQHPAAANQTFLVSDGEDLSTGALVQRMAQAMERPSRSLPVPPAMLMLAARALGKSDVAQRLLGSLQLDITHTRETLGWAPPIDVDEGLRRAVAGMAP